MLSHSTPCHSVFYIPRLLPFTISPPDHTPGYPTNWLREPLLVCAPHPVASMSPSQFLSVKILTSLLGPAQTEAPPQSIYCSFIKIFSFKGVHSPANLSYTT